MRKSLTQDLYRYVGKRVDNVFVRLRYIFFSPAYRYIFNFRHAQEAKFKPIKLMWICFLRLCMRGTGIQIPYYTTIGPGLRIMHFGMIIVNPNAKIGKNFNIAPGVLIGMSAGKHAGSPVIGDNVYIGQNATVIGGINIGNNVMIAPGAFVNFDVPDNSIVLGNPGKIISKDNPTFLYIDYPIEKRWK